MEFQDFRKVVEAADRMQSMIRGKKGRLITFKANAANSGIIYITTNQAEFKGYPLNAGEGLGDIFLEDNQDIFFWGDTAADRLEGIIYDNPYFKGNEGKRCNC